MANVHIITNLPTSLACLILNEWLVLKAVTRLDSAYCNRDCRSKYVGLLQADEFLSADSLDASIPDFVSWMVLRDVKVRRMVCALDSELENVSVAGYMQRHEKHIRVLYLSSTCTIGSNFTHLVELACSLYASTIELIRHNPELQTLTVINGLDDDYCPQLNSITLPKLQKLVFLSGNSFDIPPCLQCLISVMRMSNNLQELQLTKFYPIHRDQWLAIATHCPQLRTLHINSIDITDTDITEFTRLCPHISTLHLTELDGLTDDGILGIVQHLTQLRSLRILDCYCLTDTSLAHITQHCSGYLEEFYVGSFTMTQEALTALPTHFLKLKAYKLCSTYTPFDDAIPEDDYLYEQY